MADVPEIKPKRLVGPWDAGYALHIHTLSSVFLGYNEYGQPSFDTTRSPIGELLYQLKYRNDQSAIEQLAVAVEDFWGRWKPFPAIDAIVPVPPSVTRAAQPVPAVATAIGERLHIPLSTCVTKVKKTPQLKDVFDYDERTKALSGAFVVSEEAKGKKLLLFDDLYGSGATVSAITQAL
jgi:predicted amidophosphoribosyltransferase